MMDTDAAYDLFFAPHADAACGLIVGVTSTGIYCRPGCPARRPLRKNCRWFADTASARAGGFRACLRCHPDGRPENPALDRLVRDIETSEDPIREADLRARGLSPSTVRRAFTARFGQSFTAYQRDRRLLRADTTLAGGQRVIDAQMDAGYASASGFRAAYAKAFGTAPSGRASGGEPLRAAWLDTPLGAMLTLADSRALHLSEFTDRKALPRQVARVRRLADRPVVEGRTPVTDQFEAELGDYFAGALQTFSTPLETNGTVFQRRVWEGLRAIPYATTQSYAQLAQGIGHPTAVRAAASSNAANALAIVVPCHRIVPKAGGVGGYAGGAERKRWLLDHEAAHAARA